MLIPEEEKKEIKIRRSVINRKSKFGIENLNNLSLLNQSNILFL
jgi:hypothetical protein